MSVNSTRRGIVGAMATYSCIPDSHTAPIVKSDRCAPFVRGDVVIADWRRYGEPGSLVWAKAFGVTPQVMPFEEAAGLKIFGQIVGVFWPAGAIPDTRQSTAREGRNPGVTHRPSLNDVPRGL